MSRTKHLLLGVLLGSGILTVGAPAAAAIIVDQSFLEGVASTSGNDPMAQTFTVGVGGRLVSVDIPIFGDVDVTVDIRRTALGVPLVSDALGDQLARVTLTPPAFPDFVRVNLNPFRISVQPGDSLAIVLRSGDVHNWMLATGAAATYPGGEAFLRPGPVWERYEEVFPFPGDFQFRTRVRVPEPATLSLWGVGVALLARRRRASPRRSR
jgi:hypothetical protein